MSRRWKNILDGAGDENIGAALIRLAKMAQSVHEFEVADRNRAKGEHASISFSDSGLIVSESGSVEASR